MELGQFRSCPLADVSARVGLVGGGAQGLSGQGSENDVRMEETRYCRVVYCQVMYYSDTN